LDISTVCANDVGTCDNFIYWVVRQAIVLRRTGKNCRKIAIKAFAFVTKGNAFITQQSAFVSRGDAFASTHDAFVTRQDGFATKQRDCVTKQHGFVTKPNAFVPSHDGFVARQESRARGKMIPKQKEKVLFHHKMVLEQNKKVL